MRAKTMHNDLHFNALSKTTSFHILIYIYIYIYQYMERRCFRKCSMKGIRA